MQETLAREFILGTRLDARDTFRKLQDAGYGLIESDEVDGGGYEFTFGRPGDRATSVILLLPDTGQEHPDFVVMRDKSELPFWKRGGSDVCFPTREEARWYWEDTLGSPLDHVIKPLINVFALS